MGMPELFRHKALIPATRLGSWGMNYFFKFLSEAKYRAFKGQPRWSDGAVRLPWGRRVSSLKYIVIGGLVLNTLGYGRSYFFGAAPTGFPPGAQFALNLYLYLVNVGSAGDEGRRKTAKGRMLRALKTFIPGYLAYRDIEAIWTGRKDLKSLFFYEKIKKQRRRKLKKRKLRRRRR